MRGAVAVELTALGTAMDNDISLARIGFHANRLHFATAFASSVTRVDIDMERPKTKRAMVA